MTGDGDVLSMVHLLLRRLRRLRRPRRLGVGHSFRRSAPAPSWTRSRALCVGLMLGVVLALIDSLVNFSWAKFCHGRPARADGRVRRRRRRLFRRPDRRRRHALSEHPGPSDRRPGLRLDAHRPADRRLGRRVRPVRRAAVEPGRARFAAEGHPRPVGRRHRRPAGQPALSDLPVRAGRPLRRQGGPG